MATPTAPLPERSLTLLNATGDITLTWTPDRDGEFKAMIEKKMQEGWSFFIVKPAMFGLVKRTVALANTDDIGENRTVILKDKDAEALFLKGGVEITTIRDLNKIDTDRRSKDPEEVVNNHTVAVRPLRGG
jgi:hypothetical protein